MSNEEAIKVLETQPFYECIEVCVPASSSQCDICKNNIALKMAIQALKKQTPMPLERKDNWICPECGQLLTEDQPHCGQKCGDCKYLNLNDRTSIGYLCEHPDRPFSLMDANHIKRFGYSIAARVYTSKKACKRWEQR